MFVLAHFGPMHVLAGPPVLAKLAKLDSHMIGVTPSNSVILYVSDP